MFKRLISRAASEISMRVSDSSVALLFEALLWRKHFPMA